MTATEQPEPQSPASEPAVEPTADTVGGLLRAQRLALGRDVAFVAEHLRIRAAYIRAIEEGRYMDLPGSTYAIGFVRSYAEFLGLDVPSTVTRFKDETAGGLHNKPELFFPSPVSEGRIPGGAILFLGLMLAGIAYGSWYYMSSHDGSVIEMVAELPERFQAMIGGGGSGETAQTTAAAPATTTTAPTSTPAPAPAPAPAKIEMPPAAGKPVATAAATATPAAVPAPAAAAPAAPAAPPPAPEPAHAAATAPAAAPPAAKPDEQAVPPDEEEEAPKPVTAAAAPAVPTDHPPPLDNGKIYGAYNTDSRVTIRSRDSAWVEIHEKGKKIWAQNLRKGDVYRVPNKADLTLMTGSAGALDVFVDGRGAPSLGQMGTVRRGIQLDPEKLMAGQ